MSYFEDLRHLPMVTLEQQVRFRTAVIEAAKKADEEIATLRTKLEAAEKDAGRLDWLEKHCTGASDSERYLPFRVYWKGKGIRKTIDKAMEAKP